MPLSQVKVVGTRVNIGEVTQGGRGSVAAGGLCRSPSRFGTPSESVPGVRSADYRIAPLPGGRLGAKHRGPVVELRVPLVSALWDEVEDVPDR
jgi:hypothetical protein